MKKGNDPFLYSVANVLAQTATAPETFGFYEVRFYSDGGRPSRVKTDRIETFYYYPSGGTLRDKDMNIIFYEPKLDIYNATSRLGAQGEQF
jgi:hypothetical protein